MAAPTDRVRTIHDAEWSSIATIRGGGAKRLVASGRLDTFRATWAEASDIAEGIAIDGNAARLLEVGVGSPVVHVGV
jgi:arginine/ornithine N-succinyltransferase beta subunit